MAYVVAKVGSFVRRHFDPLAEAFLSGMALTMGVWACGQLPRAGAFMIIGGAALFAHASLRGPE